VCSQYNQFCSKSVQTSAGIKFANILSESIDHSVSKVRLNVGGGLGTIWRGLCPLGPSIEPPLRRSDRVFDSFVNRLPNFRTRW